MTRNGRVDGCSSRDNVPFVVQVVILDCMSVMSDIDDVSYEWHFFSS